MATTDLALFSLSLAISFIWRRYFVCRINPSNEMTNPLPDEAQSILEFWFNGKMKENYKYKWFPTGSLGLQKQADDEIQKHFLSIFIKAINGQLSLWLYSRRATVALIVALDQFSRHIYRSLPADASERVLADQLALQLAERFTENEEWDSGLTVAEFVFSLMPLRHTATVSRLERVMSEIERRRTNVVEEQELLTKFMKQTLRRLQHLQDRSKVQETEGILERQSFVTDESDILAHPLTRSTAAFLDRMGVSPTQTLVVSLSGGVDSMVIVKILSVLRLYPKGPVPVPVTDPSHNPSPSHSPAPSPSPAPILCVHIDYANRPESVLEADFLRQWVDTIARDAATAASSERLGSEVGSVPLCQLRVRRVDEVTRGVTERDRYERVTREIRYALYRDTLKGTGGGVMLGHHQDDLRENVISNVMRGGSALGISGMQEVGDTEGAAIWRPLLPFPKADIFEFAHRYGVPYFKDTTPSWSTRGKLRTQLMPLLLEMYGEGCPGNLSRLAVDSDETCVMMDRFVYAPFHRSVQRFPCGLLVDTRPFVDHPLAFWRTVLKELMHSQHRGLVREASVLAFVTRLRRRDEKGVRTEEWVELRRGAAAKVSGLGELMVFEKGVLRGEREETRWDEHWTGFRVALHTEGVGEGGSPIPLPGGNWTVRLSVETLTESESAVGVEGSNPPSDRCVKKGRGVSVRGLSDGEGDRGLLAGVLTYTLLVPATCRHLVPLSVAEAWQQQQSDYQSRNKDRTPTFARSIDKRLLQGLPLLVGEPEPVVTAADTTGSGSAEGDDTMIGSTTTTTVLLSQGYRVQVELRFTPS